MANRILKGVELYWCKFNTVDQYGHYGCQLVLKKAHADQLKEWGLKTKKDDEGKIIFRCRRREDDGPVPVVDKDLTPVVANVSNGAIGNVMLDVYEYKKFGGGIAARLKKVQLLKWEPYDSGEDFEEVEETEDDLF